MGIRIIPAVIGGSITIAVVRVMTTLNIERAAEAIGNDVLLLNVWTSTSRFLDYIFDPAGAWTIWLLLGIAIGGALFSYGRNFKDGLRGQRGGPPFWYLGLQARGVRFAIRHRWARVLIGDFEAAFENLGCTLTDIHGFPPLPAQSFRAPEDDLKLTREYLRLIIPKLSSAHIGEARVTANRFKRRSRSEILARLP